MKFKNKILILSLGLIYFAAYLTLTILVIPDKVPILYDFYEKISLTATKWVLIIPASLPLILATLIAALKNKPKLEFFLKIIFVFMLYENTICIANFCFSNNLSKGLVSEVPLSLMLFLPLAFTILILSIKLKNVPYLSRIGINFKATRETEFLWKQTHIFARDVFFVISLFLLVISVIFCLVRLPIVPFSCFVVLILAGIIRVYFYSKSIYKTYMEMKTRKEKLDQGKIQKQEKNPS